jgi:tRNA (adenine37-N6)-methyltransferase
VFEKREGEQELGFDPGTLAGDEAGLPATVAIDEAYRRGLAGLERASHVVILTWLHNADRNLIVQKPRHASAASGVFALRSPARPNPIGLHIARLVSIDVEDGTLALEAIDALDGTPVIDVKPYFASVDSVPEATVRRTEDI